MGTAEDIFISSSGMANISPYTVQRQPAYTQWTSDQGQRVISIYPLADCLIAGRCASLGWSQPGAHCWENWNQPSAGRIPTYLSAAPSTAVRKSVAGFMVVQHFIIRCGCESRMVIQER